MISLFGLFGRSREVRLIEDGVRAHGLHKALVPDAVKFTVVRLLKETPEGVTPESTCRAGELLAWCMLGEDEFTENNGTVSARHADARVAEAIESGDSLDAQLVLLTLKANVCHPAIIDRYGLSAE
ncbi:hypothetical protein [Caenispirillum salinarum]|uniref:hypothetical protein n=1 Tax=Caenispirillum salinarum TaxID=859058 RepID=UPI00384DAA7A